MNIQHSNAILGSLWALKAWFASAKCAGFRLLPRSLAAAQAIELIGTRGKKITRIGSLAVAAPSLKALKLRSNLLGRMADVAGLTSLVELELYENRIRRLEGLDGMTCESLLISLWLGRGLKSSFAVACSAGIDRFSLLISINRLR